MKVTQSKTLFNTFQRKTLVYGSLQGLVLATVVGVLAYNIVNIPLLSIPGPLVIAILVGIAWRTLMGIPEYAGTGISFASKKLLRYGIILMGVRLNLDAIFAAGPRIIFLDASIIILAIGIICYLGKVFAVEKKLSLLTAVGTGICGAAAIAAIAPTINSNEDETVVSVATVAVLGTVGSILYILLQPFLGFNLYEYGIFAGSTLHEVAHVVAAAQPAGSTAVDMAVVTKLGRVALLIPVALVINLWFNLNDKENEQTTGWRGMTIPWFIFGFFGLSCLNTVGLIPEDLASIMMQASSLLLTVAMAGMGLSVDLVMFKRMGLKSLVIGVIGSLIISITGLLAIHIIDF
ncbi:MAG: YeiH family protein [Bacillota bacterium]